MVSIGGYLGGSSVIGFQAIGGGWRCVLVNWFLQKGRAKSWSEAIWGLRLGDGGGFGCGRLNC